MKQATMRRTIIPVFNIVLLFVSVATFAQQANTNGSQRLQSWQIHQQMADDSRFAKLKWQRMGPKFAGGRIESIDAPKGNLGTIYVGVGSGGVWKTENEGLTWKPIFENESTFAIGDLTVAPSNSSTIWVGTGECHVGRMSYAGTGVFKSEDAGQSWTNMGLHESFHIGQIAIDPNDENVVYVAAMGSRRAGGQRGIFKTTDGGESFRRVLFAGERVSFVDLVIDPADPSRLYASAWDRGGSNESGVYRSDDHGESWSRLENGLPLKDIDRVAIAVSKSKPGVVYALMADRSSPNLARRRPASILFRSDDHGDSWDRTHKDYVPTYIGWDFCDVRVAPDDENLVYIGGLRLITSHDGGKTFQGEGGFAHNTTRENVFRLHAYHGMGLHLDVHDIWIDPEHPERVFLGNDGGLFVSKDRGQTWLHLNNLPIAEFYRVHLDDREPFQIWGGTQDNASFVGPSSARFENGEDDEWKQVFLDPWSGGDGFATFPDPYDSHTVFFTQQNGDLKRAKSGDLSLGKRIKPRAGNGESKLRWAWDTPFFASVHSNTTVLYCAAQRVLRSGDRGDSWESISPDFGQRGLLALAESPLDSRRLVTGGVDSKIHFTQDGGEKWTTSEDLPRATITSIVCSSHDVDRIYVTLSKRVQEDFSSHVFVSNDFGASWTSIVSNLPRESINTIAEDAKTEGLLFVGTDLGCYVSTDGGKIWDSLCASLPTAPVLDLKVHAGVGTLVAATHGLSLFSLSIGPIRKATPETHSKAQRDLK